MKWTSILPCAVALYPASAFVAPSLIVTQGTSRVRAPGAWVGRQHDPSSRSLRNSAPTMNMSRGEEGEKLAAASETTRFARGVKTAFTSAAIGLTLAGPMVSLPGTASAGDKRTVGEISASGLVFKDKLNVEAFSDPKVKGVTLYLSDFARPVADKLMNGDIFSDPSSASLFCVRSGPMEVKDGISTSKEGEELFKEDRSFLKSIVVRRLYDKETNNIVYVSYSSKLDTGSDGNKSRFKSSLCALHIE
ncbi:unnamed protein product [Ectocarpus sp. CCAP 1310/34]|nr:unnamed protein product [Ectocarpus sp. CCAP 1310/34]